jgi:hypothetical protein
MGGDRDDIFMEGVSRENVKHGEIERKDDDDRLWEGRKLTKSSLAIWIVEATRHNVWDMLIQLTLTRICLGQLAISQE